MKKQIFILSFLLLAVFSSINNAYGQVGLSSAPVAAALAAPKTITAACTSDGLAPIAGKSYTYTVDVPTPPGTKTFHWLVTKDLSFISGGSFDPTPQAKLGGTILDYGTDYDNPTVGKTSIDITWDYFVHNDASPVFLVVYVTNDATCDNNNMEVYIIKPKHSFTLDVANISIAGTSIVDGGVGSCAAGVASAVYDVDEKKVIMNYGINYLFFSVTAANFKTSWLPKFQVSGTGITGNAGDRSVTAIDWQYTSLATTATGWNSTSITNDDGLYTGTAPTTTPVNASVASGGTVGHAGESIIVRVTINNGRSETITAESIEFAVDGTMLDPVNSNYADALLGDVHNLASAVGTDSCPWVDGFVNDKVTQLIGARPNINEVTPASPAFVPKN